MGNVLDNNNNPTFYNVSYGDSFKKWIDQYNALVDKLESKTFAANGEFVDLQSSQRIDGVKIFDDNTSFSRSVTINGDLVLPHSGNGYNLIETDNVNNSIKFNYSIDEAGSVNFVGANGINFLSNQNAPGFSLSFVDPSTSDILVLDYENSGGTFKIASNTQLEVENSSIKIGSNTWNFPSFPLAESVLTYDTGTSAIVWKTATSLVEDLTSEIASSVALINTNEMMPVGTIIDVDKTKISNDWNNGGLSATGPDDTNFYGWLIINGQTLTAPNENSDFAEIVNLINPPVGTPTYPRQAVLSLANTTGGSPAAETVKLIKYLPDAVSSFALIKGNGISFGLNLDNTTLRNSATLKNGTTNISLNVDTEVFEFDSNGQLKIKTNIPRYTSSRLTTETPVNDTDAANKKYVLDKISAGGIEGCCYDFMLASDGLGYADAKNSFSIVDKHGTGRAWRTVATNTLSASAGYTIDSDVTLNAISPFKESSFGKVVPLKKTFATQDQFFFIDENDAIYGYGTNSLGDIGASSRGIGEFGGYYNGFFPANPYNSAVPVRQLLPAFLPQKTVWNANVVLFESATGISGSNDASANITIKTKDGYDNVYKTDPTLPTNGLLDYLNNEVPYTRGYYLSTGLNTGGQLGRGNTTSTNATTGPLVWGSRIDAPGRNLWYNFALTETQKETIKTAGELTTLLNTSTSSEQIRKRFNWFKPNAITAGGLATAAPAALTEWRTQTGLTTEAFNDYSWYIKKVVRTIDAHYVIVGKPGNESDNEVWCAGINRKGAFGNLRASTLTLTDFAPMLSESETSHNTNTYRITPGTPLVSGKGKIFERHDNLGTAIPHGIKDFENLRLGTVNYYVILGNTAGQNRSTQFRLFSTFNGAQSAFIGVDQTINIVSLDNTSTTGIARAGSHRARCKGIIDISVSRGAAADLSGDGIILRKALTFSSFNAADYLDRVPENLILTDSILACGSNVSSRLGLNVTTVLDPNIPVITSFTQTRGKIVKMVTCNFSAVSFLLSDQGVLYFAGNRASGCSDSGSITGTLTSWTPIPKSNVKDFFVIDDIDGTTSLTRIFVITEIAGVTPTYELYAGGFNKGYVLGTSVGVNATGTGSALTNFAKIIFPESPKNIVNIAGATNQTYILCKNQGEDIGRVYVTGTEVSRSYFPVSSILKIFPQFKNIDRDIL